MLSGGCERRFAKKSKEDARISVSIGYTTTSEANCDTEQLLQVAEEWMLRNKLFSRESHRNNVINAILSMLYEKSTETREHSERMAGVLPYNRARDEYAG